MYIGGGYTRRVFSLTIYGTAATFGAMVSVAFSAVLDDNIFGSGLLNVTKVGSKHAGLEWSISAIRFRNPQVFGHVRVRSWLCHRLESALR
jgi:hypothetical protein